MLSLFLKTLYSVNYILVEGVFLCEGEDELVTSPFNVNYGIRNHVQFSSFPCKCIKNSYSMLHICPRQENRKQDVWPLSTLHFPVLLFKLEEREMKKWEEFVTSSCSPVADSSSRHIICNYRHTWGCGL